MQLTGAGANTYTGTTTVNDGTLVLNKGAEAVPGNLVIGDGIGAANSAVVQLGLAVTQSLAVNGAPTASFTLNFNGATTGALALSASATQVQAQLNGLSTIGGVGGLVTVTLAGGTYTITFGGTLAGSLQPLITATAV